MSPALGTIISGAFASFVTNMIVHAFVLVGALTMVPMDLLIAVAVAPFLPVWIVVLYGLVKIRRWSFKLGLVVSILGVAFSIVGILIGLLAAYITIAFDFLQIFFCLLGLRAKF
jgi:hypothetical protein